MDQLPQDALGRHAYGTDGANPSRVRNHNERLVLSVVKNEGQVASSQIARLTSLSAQTASIITRSLEADGMLLRGEPQKGRVGKPSVPVFLNPEGALAYGLRIGRRGADLILMNIVGDVVAKRATKFSYPMPETIDAFARQSMTSIGQELAPHLLDRIVGIGVATPFGLWKKAEAAGAPDAVLAVWRAYDFGASFASFTDLPVLLANDASMGCSGELVFGAAHELSDFLYFYVGAFVGGGVVLGGRVFFGRNGNAGAFGTLVVGRGHGASDTLINSASIYTLERDLAEQAGQEVRLHDDSSQWSLSDPLVDAWVSETARALAIGAVSAAAVVDVDTAVVDGNFPTAIKTAILARMRNALQELDTQEISEITVQAGTLGRSAAAMGAAYQPILAAHFLEGSSIDLQAVVQ
ncbi:MAG: ROK family transcriptional regulator [Hyphomicrobiales bacterium]